MMKGKGVLKTTGATLVVLAILEGLLRVTYFVRNSMVEYIPLPYHRAGDYGPIPPWMAYQKLIKPDETLVWRGGPNFRRKYIDVFSPVPTEEERSSLLRRFLPSIPDSLRGNPVWEISLNSEGFRDVEFPKTKSPLGFRILCLGDSWTFGSNVGQEEAYPQRLRGLLKQEFPEANFEVFNLGVLGYASYNGLQLLKTRGIQLQPDLVVIAFAMNEPGMAGYRKRDPPANKERMTLRKRMARALGEVGSFSTENVEIYRLLRYWALLINWKPQSIAEHLKRDVSRLAWQEEGLDSKKPQEWLPVSLREYEEYLLEMIHLARGRGAGVILVYNEFWREGPYRRILEKVSRAEGVPLVDSSALLAEAKRKIEEELEGRLDLRPSEVQQIQARDEVEVVFRVYQGGHPVSKTMSIVGAHPNLGDLVPNKVAMYDDGTHGDQRAGDRVWSYSATFTRGTTLFYTYTNSGEKGKWEGLDVPAIRRFKVEVKDNQEQLYAPIDTFGKMYTYADPWHTNAAGNELIARTLLEKLKENPKVKGYLAGIRTK